MVRGKPAVADGVFELVDEGRFIDLEKAQGVAHEELVLFVVEFFTSHAGRGRQADLNPVEMLQHPAPLAVNAAVAFIADDQIEISRRIIAVDIDHALQRGDGDLLFVLKAAAGAQHMAGIVRQMLGESVFGLLRKGMRSTRNSTRVMAFA